MKKIKFEDKDFPRKLRYIANPPKQIYIEGSKSILNNNLIAVVGSRKNTEYGKKWCEKFCKDLLKYNLNIVSGMAIGIDTIAHKTSILENVPTIAVLPSGLENIYPKKNIDLYKKIILGGGAVISEYEPENYASSEKFLERNRIVAGLSIAVLVVEAAYRSGTSVTAKLAKEQEKKVFCIPGSLENKKSVGTNRLIQEGAILAVNAEDIVINYDFLHKDKSRKKLNINKDEEKIDEKYKKIYDLISEDGIYVNDIIKMHEADLSYVMQALTMLEISGKIRKSAGNKYIKI